MQISVTPGAFAVNFQQLAQDVVDVVTTRITGNPPLGVLPVVCGQSPQPPQPAQAVPQVHWPPTTAGVYTIDLAVVGDFPVQFAWQLAHELGHVFMAPSRTNSGVEMVATALSLRVLRDLASKYRTTPGPCDAGSFGSYSGQHFEQHPMFKTVPDKVSKAMHKGRWHEVAAHLTAKRAALAATTTDHQSYYLGARYLLAENDPFPWDQVIGLALRAQPGANGPNGYSPCAPFAAGQTPTWLQPVYQ